MLGVTGDPLGHVAEGVFLYVSESRVSPLARERAMSTRVPMGLTVPPAPEARRLKAIRDAPVPCVEATICKFSFRT